MDWPAITSWLWENRTDVRKLVSELYSWLRRPTAVDGRERGILILGAGGVGKSTLARILSGQFDWLLDEPWRYEESFGIETYSIGGEKPVAVAVLPGQKARRESTWGQLLANLTAGEYRGVILVSANGYHDPGRASYKTHAMYHGNKEAFTAELLEANRVDERSIIDLLMPALRNSKDRLWLLSVVTKEDLWFGGADTMAAWLPDGERGKRFAGVTAIKGAAAFRFEAASTSLVVSNFVTGEGEVLAKNLAGYDHKRSIESIRRLMEVLTALQEWEESK